MSTTDTRAAFEAWVQTRPGYPFAGSFANLMWASWQAATEATEATAPAQDLRAAILALPLPDAWFRSMKRGGMLSEDGYSLAQVQELLKAAAALASPADALVAGDRVDAEPVASINTEEFRKLVSAYMKYADSPNMTSGHCAWSQLVKYIDSKLAQARINARKEST